MASDVIRPVEVQIDGNQIIILWDDGHRSIYPHRFLRLRCHCANCVEEMTGKPRLDPDQVPQNVTAVDQMQVGNYAYVLFALALPVMKRGLSKQVDNGVSRQSGAKNHLCYSHHMNA